MDGGVLASPGLVAAQLASGNAASRESPLARPESRNSVNFSYPISPRSPTPSMDDRRGGSDPTWSQQPPPRVVSPGPPRGAAGFNETQALPSGTEQASRPVKKKKKSVSADGTNGTQSRNGTIGTPTGLNAVTYGGPPKDGSGPVVGQPPMSNNLDPTVIAPKKKKKKKVVTTAPTPPDRPPSADYASSMAYHSDLDTISENGDDVPERPTRFKTRAAALLVKQPSIVREDRELEENAETSNMPKGRPRETKSPVGGSGSGWVRANKGQGTKEDGQLAGPPSSVKHSRAINQHSRSSSQPAPTLAASSAGPRRADYTESSAKTPAGRGKGSGRGGRPQSLSPTRYARFAATPPASSPLVVKHEPPPRALSPAKSALKQPPSPRPGSAASQVSNTGFVGHGLTGNEPSDRSLLSEAATSVGAGGSKKRNNRVSFDEESVVYRVDDVLPGSPTHPEHYIANTGEGNKDGKNLTQDVDEDFLRPRPALPLFGSVRDHKEKDNDRQDAQHQLPLDGNAAGQIAYASDVGGVNDVDALGQKSLIPSGVNIPLNDRSVADQPLTEAAGEKSEPNMIGSGLVQSNDVMPSFQFTQPTPSLEQSDTMPSWEGSSLQEHGHMYKPPSPTPALAGVAEPEPEEAARNHGYATPLVGHVAEGLRLHGEHPRIEESDDGGSSVYSDAAEDIARTEGDGFGSIDAVVDSPSADDTTTGLAITTPPDSPTRKLTDGKTIDSSGEASPAGQGDWDQAQAYWSGLSQRQKRELERAAVVAPPPPADTEPVEALKPMVKKRKKRIPEIQDGSAGVGRGSALAGLSKQPVRQTSPSGPSSNGNVRIVPLKPPQVSTGPHLPKTMRGGPQQSAPSVSGARSTGPPGMVWVKKAPKNTQPEPAPVDNFTQAVRTEIRNLQAPSVPPVAAPATSRKKTGTRLGMMRTKSNDSNSSASSSSFKKSRPRASSSSGMTMRTTMRAGSQPANASVNRMSGVSEGLESRNRSSRFSIRSLSPTGSTMRRPFSPPPVMPSAGKGVMKTSLRGPQGSGVSTLRRPQSADYNKAPSSFAGFGRSSKPKTGGMKSGPKSGPSSRRFSDSSDDNDVGTALPKFQSRYRDDSDDEDDGVRTKPLAPVRGIPRAIGEEDGESSELSDESSGDERAGPQKVLEKRGDDNAEAVVGSSSLGHNNGSGMDLSKRMDEKKDSKKKKRSFFAAALGRKHDDAKVKKSGEAVIGSMGKGDDKENGKVFTPTMPSSPAAASSPLSSFRPRLGKRNSSMTNSMRTRMGMGTSAAEEDNRPRTSDGVVRFSTTPSSTTKARGGKRFSGWSSSGGQGSRGNEVLREEGIIEEEEGGEGEVVEDVPVGGGVAIGRNGKKKKFGKLRRVFGLHD